MKNFIVSTIIVVSIALIGYGVYRNHTKSPLILNKGYCIKVYPVILTDDYIDGLIPEGSMMFDKNNTVEGYEVLLYKKDTLLGKDKLIFVSYCYKRDIQDRIDKCIYKVQNPDTTSSYYNSKYCNK
jgi:hypothetical protein